MERRLRLARNLPNPKDSVLIVAIDEKEYLRLGLLLEQTFPDARIQMVSSVINPKGQSRRGVFGRTDEYLYFVYIGEGRVAPAALADEWRTAKDSTGGNLYWQPLRRKGLRGAVRREDRPNLFYPLYLRTDGSGVAEVGYSIPLDAEPSYDAPEGTICLWPLRAEGGFGYWQVSAPNCRRLIERGYLRVNTLTTEGIRYLKLGEQAKVESEVFKVTGRRADGSIITDGGSSTIVPGTQWRIPSHDAGIYGTNILSALIPSRRFPFPKSLYAVEDALRFVISTKPDAVVLDFFAGSGTAAHAVMRLNKQDGGRRRSISATNTKSARKSRIGFDALASAPVTKIGNRRGSATTSPCRA